ncbi:hypothetical protein [Vagococcus fessus]|uniref:Uncharacterized protein n=1 Tax=Vagococcus fessus TaxID=120370 RepID=A0A430A598_9ENTE|nr:hypothetical protein [Vagococcus fessus]RSU01944.1 hypothetical protein CBF31_09255 [Vagococcus fessus]
MKKILMLSAMLVLVLTGCKKEVGAIEPEINSNRFEIKKILDTKDGIYSTQGYVYKDLKTDIEYLVLSQYGEAITVTKLDKQ